MPAVDPHENEPKKEINKDKYLLLLAIREAIAQAQVKEKELVAEIKEEMGEATAATVDGATVLTYRYKQGWSTSGLIRDYPELVEHYMTMNVKRELDMYQFAAHHPDIAQKYQTREFREAVS